MNAFVFHQTHTHMHTCTTHHTYAHTTHHTLVVHMYTHAHTWAHTCTTHPCMHMSTHTNILTRTYTHAHIETAPALYLECWLTCSNGSVHLSLDDLCSSCTQAISAATYQWTAPGLPSLRSFCMSRSLQGAPSQLNPLDFEKAQNTPFPSFLQLITLTDNMLGWARQAHEECSKTSFLFFHISCHQSPAVLS